jgi:hypothetical protein
MSGCHIITSHSKSNDILLRKTFSTTPTDHGSSFYDFDDVCYLSMKSAQASHTFHYDFHDRIEAWLEESFFKKFPLNGKYHIKFFMTRCFNVLIFSIFHDKVLQFLTLMFDCYFSVGLEFLIWLHWL